MTRAPLTDISGRWTQVPGRIPMTLWLGLAYVLVCQALLFSDLRHSRRGALHEQSETEAVEAHPPATAFGEAARFVAVNMTPLVWPGYVLLLEGVLALQAGSSPVRNRPNHFALLCLGSIVIWCVFDWMNFYFMNGHGRPAWEYIGMPIENRWHRYWGYALAFAAIVPGMLMSGQVFLNLGWFDSARSTNGWRMPRWAKWAALGIGAIMFVLPIAMKSPKGNLTLWTSLVLLLDPINLKLGRPSMFRDWQNGWYGRTLAAFAGGLLCGLLWEFWNYWALAKWVYHLPFLGAAEHLKYFEMPVVGLLGFIPFGLECWVMWQTLRIPLDALAESLPDERQLL